MLSKLSVKKPYTVVVAVVMVLILGYVSFTRMTTDLFPDMELPYALVITTYPGASPEEVESRVTVSIEERMSTINNIKNVSSVSNENYSMVILEFEQDTNMDSVSLDMRESLDQLKAGWDNDQIGSPIIMKLNPDMMPIMIAGVENTECKDAKELTDFVEDKILPNLQSVEGVASVSASGELEDKVQVVVRQEKIDALNRKIRASLDDKFADSEKELSDAKDKISDAKDELNSKKDQLDTGKSQMADQIGKAQSDLSNKQSELLKTQADIESKLSIAKQSLTYLKKLREELVKQKENLTSQYAALEAAPAKLESINSSIESLEKQAAKIAEEKLKLEELKKAASSDAAAGIKESVSNQAESIKETVAQGIEAAKDEASKAAESAGIKTEDIQKQIDALNKQAESINKQLEELRKSQSEASNSVKGIDAAKNTLKASIEKVDSGIADTDKSIGELESGISQMETALSQIKSGRTSLDAALAELNSKSISSSIDMAAGEAGINSGLAQIETQEKELESAEDKLKDGKDTAYESADANEIITLDFVKQLLNAQSFSMPAGYISEKGVEYLIRVGDKAESTEDVENTVLINMHMKGLDAIRIKDIADVVVKDNSDEVYANMNGNPGIVFAMEKQTGYSTGDVCKNIKERFEKLESAHNGVKFITLMDQGVYIDMIVKSVLKNLMYGAVLAIIILLLFLKDLRPTFIIACSIPISILTCIVLMYFSGITLNIISLSGLALGVGMLVDNSIVVIENIYRMRKEGAGLKEAAMEGASQVAGAIIASTLTTVCVFAPIVFTEGLTRQLFVDMGLTIAYSLLSSLIVALTLVPMLGSCMLSKTSEKRNVLIEVLQNAYEKAIYVCLRFKAVVIIASIALLVLSGVLAVSRGTALIPEMGSNQASLTITVDSDKSFSDLTKVSDEVTKRLLKIPGITDTGVMAGSSGGSVSIASMNQSSDKNSSTMYLILDEKVAPTGEKLEKAILDKTKDLDCEIEVTTSMMDISALTSKGISIRVTGRNLDDLSKTSKDIAAIVKKVKGTQNVSDGIKETTPELRITVDGKKAMNYGLTTAQVYAAVAGKIKEESKTMTLSSSTDDYDVYVIDGEKESFDRAKIKKLKIEGTDKDKKKVEVAINKIATFSDAEGLSSISRNNQNRYLTVSAEIADSYNIGKVSEQIKKELKDYKIKEGCAYEMVGEDESINEAFNQIGLMLVLALAFMYLIMVAQFQSLLSPFIIMFTIPLAFTGGLFGLYISGSEISMIALIGFVMLSGIIVNNGIVMVDYINQLIAAGVEKRDAIAQAGKTRLRPIIMTALTTILAMSTMIFSTEMGSAMSRPMAIVTVGGLLYGTLLTLFVIPCVYALMKRGKGSRKRKKKLIKIK